MNVGDVLDDVEVRVLGCLVEKQLTTPEQYPLSLNALVNACNQTSNRHPVVSYDDRTVEQALTRLRERGLTRTVYPTHGRGVVKYRQVFDEAWLLDGADRALLTVLFLRGPQTAGELKGRTERLHAFDDSAEVERRLEALAARDEPLVVRLGRAPGQKEARWAHLASGPVDEAAWPDTVTHGVPSGRADRIAELEAQVGAQEARLADLEARLAHLEELLS